MKQIILSLVFATVTFSIAGQSIKKALPDSVIMRADSIIETDSKQIWCYNKVLIRPENLRQ